MRASFILILLAISACSDEAERGSEQAPPQNAAASSRATVHTGVLSVGFHGPVFSTDEEIHAEIAEAKGGFWETVGMPIEAEDAAQAEFRRVLDRAISEAAEAGVPKSSMQWRVALEGAPKSFATDGYTHQFRLRRIISIEPCPQEPVSGKECPDYL